MKKYTSHGLIILILTIGCNSPEKNNPQKDSTVNTTVQLDTVISGNMVKSEAPDANTKITQGYALPRFDDKILQSPVNILTDSTSEDSNQAIRLVLNSGITAVENLGHTIQLDFKDGSTAFAYGKTYSSKQFHFHTPSEHLIDGMTFPMEMHIVNAYKDSTSDNQTRYLVIALLFKMGRENKFLGEFINTIPSEEEKDSLPKGTVKLEDLLSLIPKNEQGYYSYKGSLTTAPYTETVDWIVKKYILEASPEQIFAIEKMEGNNARHVQALYGRKVFRK